MTRLRLLCGIKKITAALGLSFPTCASEEQSYLNAAHEVNLTGWELDGLLFGLADYVVAAVLPDRAFPRSSQTVIDHSQARALGQPEPARWLHFQGSTVTLIFQPHGKAASKGLIRLSCKRWDLDWDLKRP